MTAEVNIPGRFAVPPIQQPDMNSWVAPDEFLRGAGVGIFDGINMCPDSPYYECIVDYDPQDPAKLVVTILGKETNNSYVSLDADKFCKDVAPLAVDSCVRSVIVEWDGTNGKDDRMLSLGADYTTHGPVRDMYPVVDCPPGNTETLCVADTEIYNPSVVAPRIPFSKFVNALDNNSQLEGKIDMEKLAEQGSVFAAKLSLLAGAFFFVRQFIRDKYSGAVVQGREWKRKSKVFTGTKRQ